MKRVVVAALAAVSLGALSIPVHAQTPGAAELGTINFPTSARPAAQAAFLTGTKALVTERLLQRLAQGFVLNGRCH